MQNQFDLSGRNAVVTGATTGMGLSIARALGAAGASVLITGRDASSAGRVADTLRGEGIKATALALDVSDAKSVAVFADDVRAAFSQVDILVLNAAGSAPEGSILTHSAEQFDAVMAANVRPNIVLVNAIAPGMMERRDGAIVFTSSRAAKRGSAMLGLYGMSKAAIDQYVRNLALELGPFNINVNSINPGPVRTAFSRSLWDSEEKTGKLEAIIPMGRIGAPDDVAGLALLLASPAGRFIHGQNISVDGGLTA
jgi:NAD(P)-dependent dehydrogenase (short-subunit alcohol dehydrogenase family)